MRKLMLTIESGVAHEHTAATLTLLKLCRSRFSINLISGADFDELDSTIRSICQRDKVVHIFMRQLEQKKTSLLAAYALKTCLKLGKRA